MSSVPCVGWEFQKEIAHLQGFHNTKLQKLMHFSAVMFISFPCADGSISCGSFFFFFFKRCVVNLGTAGRSWVKLQPGSSHLVPGRAQREVQRVNVS